MSWDEVEPSKHLPNFEQVRGVGEWKRGGSRNRLLWLCMIAKLAKVRLFFKKNFSLSKLCLDHHYIYLNSTLLLGHECQ